MLSLMSACVVVVVAMVASINLALPRLSASSLHPSSSQLLWIVDAYILVFGCLLIPAGALADRLGRKGVLLVGLALFAVGCLGSAAAPGVVSLLVARVVTGVGAALVMPATLSLLLQVTPPERKPHAIAVWTGATGGAGAFGTLASGLTLQWFPWPALFLIYGPVALVLAGVVAWVAPRGERHPGRLDPLGSLILTAVVFAILFGLIESTTRGWTTPVVLGAFLAAAVLLGVFVVHGLRADHPVVDPRLFRIRAVRTGSIGVAVVFFGLFALFFANAQFLQDVRGLSPVVTGLAILPLPVAMFVMSRLSLPIVRRFGKRPVIAAGMLMVAAGLAALSFVGAATPYPWYALGMITVASGMGLSMPSLSEGIMTSVPPARAGMASGLNSAAREVGSALGVAVVGAVIYSSTSFLPGMATGYRVVAAIVVLGTILSQLAGNRKERTGRAAAQRPIRKSARQAINPETMW